MIYDYICTLLILYNKTIIAIEILNSFNAILMDGFLTFVFLYASHNIENPIKIVYMHEHVQIVL